jgi:hydroxymethylbilane synthase
LERHVKLLLDPQQTPPAGGQGALAITARRGDEDMRDVLAPVEDFATRLEITAERAFLSALDGSCRTPIAALGRWSDGVMRFIGESLTPDGARCWRRTAQETCATESEAAALGERLGHSIKAEAGEALYRD